MRPKVIMHHTVSVDGAISGFEVDMGLHYRIASRFGAEAHLVGSTTARIGAEMFGADAVEEAEDDRTQPAIDPNDERPIWVIPDSRGALEGRLHIYRRSEYCKDVIVLISESTPSSYRNYLEDRRYAHSIVGQDRVDLAAALELLVREYHIETVLTDGGPTLCAALMGRGLVDEISLIVAPRIVGGASEPLFKLLGVPIHLAPMRLEKLENGAIGMLYRVRASEL